MDQTILAAFIAHHTPTVTPCNGTSSMNMDFSAYQYLLLLRNYLPTSIKLSLIAKHTDFSVIYPMKLPVKNFILDSPFVS
jgi:hypothetical protein